MLTWLSPFIVTTCVSGWAYDYSTDWSNFNVERRMNKSLLTPFFITDLCSFVTSNRFLSTQVYLWLQSILGPGFWAWLLDSAEFTSLRSWDGFCKRMRDIKGLRLSVMKYFTLKCEIFQSTSLSVYSDVLYYLFTYRGNRSLKVYFHFLTILKKKERKKIKNNSQYTWRYTQALKVNQIPEC